MNKKNILVVCTAVSALLIGAVSFAVSKKSVTRLSAANGKYTMTLNENNGPELTNTPSNGNFTVNTAAGNSIQFNYSGLSAGSGLVGKISQWGSLSNVTPITGMVSVVATFTGTLKVNYGLTTSEAHGEYLTSGTELEFPLTACYLELKAFTAVDLSSLTVKYDCALSEQGESARAIEAKRFELLSEFDYPVEEYRSEEANLLGEIAAPILHDIRDENATLADLNAIDVTPFTDALAAAKTNAQLMVEEAYKYPHPSEWALVNEHASHYVPGQSAFVTKGLGGFDVGFLISPYLYQDGFDAVVRCNNTSDSAADFGLFFGNDSPSGDGLDGCLVAMNYVAGDHMYLQVFKLNNGYGTGVSTTTYIDGSFYHASGAGTGDLRNDDIRITYDGLHVIVMNNEDYINNVNRPLIVVDLSANGFPLDSGSSYRFGYVNWNGDNANNFEIKKLIMGTTVDSNAVACQIADEVIARIDSTKYSSEVLSQFNALVGEIDALRASGTYAAIMAKVDAIKALKTPEQKGASDVLDNIYSGDPTKYTASTWDLVNEHGLGWSHTAGANTVVTTGLDGYVMDAAVHTDYTFVFRINNVHVGNPFGATMPGDAIIIGGEVDGTTGGYFKGYYISLSTGWGFQIYNALGGEHSTEIACYTDKFLGGYDCNAEGTTFRVTIQSGALTLYTVDPFTGVETRITGVTGGFVATDTWNINVPAGHFGILDWDLSSSTFEILEFKDL